MLQGMTYLGTVIPSLLKGTMKCQLSACFNVNRSMFFFLLWVWSNPQRSKALAKHFPFSLLIMLLFLKAFHADKEYFVKKIAGRECDLDVHDLQKLMRWYSN